jgi:hypothetical protein
MFMRSSRCDKPILLSSEGIEIPMRTIEIPMRASVIDKKLMCAKNVANPTELPEQTSVFGQVAGFHAAFYDQSWYAAGRMGHGGRVALGVASGRGEFGGCE